MLIISRKKNESLVINDAITLTVIDIRADKVRLGVVCPRDVPVHRAEVYEAIHGRRPGDAPPGRCPAEVAFLTALAERPGDGALRAVYADWLEERGDPLAEFLRIRGRLAAPAVGDPEREDLRRRERALWDEHHREWLPLLPPALW